MFSFLLRVQMNTKDNVERTDSSHEIYLDSQMTWLTLMMEVNLKGKT